MFVSACCAAQHGVPVPLLSGETLPRFLGQGVAVEPGCVESDALAGASRPSGQAIECSILADAITHKEIGTPRSHRRFLGRFQGSYGPIPAMQLPGLLPMPFNRTGLKNLYCVGDSCFPGQGLNAVAFSGFACAHRVGADLGLNSWALPA